jgi:mono/diheme cytochrome c family protein
MFKKIVNAIEALALAALAVLVLVALTYRPAGSKPIVGSYVPAAGSQIFASHCSACHGDRGQGGIGPRLAGSVATKYPNVADETAVVTNGRGGMPAWGTTLSPAEIDAVVSYTRTGL